MTTPPTTPQPCAEEHHVGTISDLHKYCTAPADGPTSTPEPVQAPAGTSGGSGHPQDGTGALSAAEAIAHLIQDATANARVANDNSNKREMVRWLEMAKWLERERDFLGIAAPATPGECGRCSGTGWEPDCGKAGTAFDGGGEGCDVNGRYCARHDPACEQLKMRCRECGGQSRRAWAVIPADGPGLDWDATSGCYVPHFSRLREEAQNGQGAPGRSGDPDWPGDIEAPDADALAAVYEGARRCQRPDCRTCELAGRAETWRDGYRTGWAARGEDRAVAGQAGEPVIPYADLDRVYQHAVSVDDPEPLRSVANWVAARYRAELDRQHADFAAALREAWESAAGHRKDADRLRGEVERLKHALDVMQLREIERDQARAELESWQQWALSAGVAWRGKDGRIARQIPDQVRAAVAEYDARREAELRAARPDTTTEDH